MKATTLKAQDGFSLVEMITATVIVTIFIFGISSILVNLGIQKESISQEINGDFDAQILSKIVSSDLLNAAPSLNNLKVPDDNGNSFFDYFPDINPTTLQGNTSRIFTLKPNQQSNIYFLLSDPHVGAPMMYDPTAAYVIGAPPANMKIQAPWQFSSLNLGGYINKLNPSLWSDNRVLMLDTPARIRSATALKTNYLQTPRSPIFIGVVQGQGLTPINFGPLDRSDPASPGQTIDSADAFLRKAPAMSGGSPIVRLKAVQIVRYTFLASKLKPGSFDIYRQTYIQNAWQNDQIFGRNIKSMEFTRSSVLQPTFSFHVTPENP